MIDKQKTSENVYFLNAVTVDDLLPLAEQDEEPAEEVTPEPEPEPTEPVGGSDRAGTRTRGRKNRQPASFAAPDRGGGADWRRCRLLLQDLQAEARSAGPGGYYCEYEDEGPEEIAEEPEDEDTPPWDEDTEEQEARQ